MKKYTSLSLYVVLIFTQTSLVATSEKPQSVSSQQIVKTSSPHLTLELPLKNSKKVMHRVRVNNEITKAMATYTKHWSGKHTPEWTLTVNGKEVKPQKEVTLNVKNNIIVVEFYFEFYALGRLHRKGTAVAEFKIDPAATSLSIEFSWDQEERLIVKNNESSSTSLKEPVLIKFYEKK